MCHRRREKIDCFTAGAKVVGATDAVGCGATDAEVASPSYDGSRDLGPGPEGEAEDAASSTQGCEET